MQRNLQAAFSQAILYVRIPFLRLPNSNIPLHDGTSARPALGKNSFERNIVYVVIRDFYSLTAKIGAVTWPLRNCPTQQHSIPPEPEVVVETACSMFLNGEYSHIGSAIVVVVNFFRTLLLYCWS